MASIIEIIVNLTVLKDGANPCRDDDDPQENVKVILSPQILRVVKGIRFLRLLRSLRLVKVSLLLSIATFININLI